MNSSQVLIIVTFLFALLGSVVAVNFWWNAPETDGELPPRRPITTGYQIFTQQIVVLAAIAGFAYFGGFNLEDIGASTTIHPVLAFVAGLAVYAAILASIELSAQWLGLRDRLHDLSFETMRMIWPRNRVQKVFAFVGVCFLNPVTEEVVYRGALVYHFGEYTNSFLIAGLIGFVLSLAAHMYQGSWSLPFQAMFHGAAVLMILSPLGLFACFGLHFAGDLVPVATMRSNMIEWRERRRRASSSQSE